VIQVNDVRKHFELRDKKTRKKKRIDAVRGISFRVSPGEIYGLLGPNGAGKSTTMRMMAGLMRPDSGSISICGISVSENPEQARKKIGYLSTDLNVYSRFTPREYLRLFGEFQGLDNRLAEKRAFHLLERLHLSDFADVRMAGFSTGQKQKVGIVRALLHDPEVVIFDEPTTGLDVLTAKTVLDLLHVMKADGRTVIISSHVMPMVEEVCDRVGIIFDGRLHGDASPRQVLDQWNVRTLDEVFFSLAATEEVA